MGLLDTLVRTESGGNWAAQNNVTGAGGMSGHFGRLQFGQARLQDAMRAGVLPQGTTPQQFMADPALQQAVERWHFSDIDQQAARMGLNRYLGQSVGGIPITQDAIRAMAHLGGIGGAKRFLESGGQYNPSDAYGTSLADYATTHGGSGNTALQGGEGNDTMAQAPQQTQRPSIWDNVPFLADADRRARLQIGLEGMTLNPNQALIQGAQSGIDRRAEQAQLNQTAEWLNAQPGGQQFAQALMSGIPADQVFGAYMQSLAPRDPLIVNDQIIDPSTYQVLADARTQQPPDPGYRPLTPEEVAAFPGLDPTKAYQVSPDGEIKPIGGGGQNINLNSIGNIPSGYELVTDPNTNATSLRAIPGGPEDTTQSDQAKLDAALTSSQVITDAGTRALEAASRRTATGLFGQLASNNPSSQNAEVYRQVDVLKSNASIENLNAMRRQSPTGGALGSVTGPENKMLADKVGALDPASPNFERDVMDYTRTLLRVIHGPEAGDALYAQWAENISKPPPEPSTMTVPPIPQGADISQTDWENAWRVMTPEQRALFQ